jgi:RNA polymerase sigma-70 factor (ECF subfamily)
MDDRNTDKSLLIQRARREDVAAREQLLEAYRNYLRLLAHTGMSAALQDKADPSDLVQETLMKAHRHFEQFRGRTEPELTTWLRQILARNLSDFVRRYHTSAARAVGRECSLEEVLDQSSRALGKLLAAPGASPSESAQRRELSVVLADALADLPADYGEVIMLHSLQELDWDEVALRMNRSAGAVRALWTRALSSLRPLIEARL